MNGSPIDVASRRQPSAPDGSWRSGFTLVELLVVVAIISLLVSILTPAIQVAREQARKAQCQSNLRQFGVGLSSNADKIGAFCTGAFDYRRDGCVTEIGWVANLVGVGTPVGEMLCPSNLLTLSETYFDLLTMAPDGTDCMDLRRKGKPDRTAPDGSTIYNPCGALFDGHPLMLTPGSEDRRAWVESKFFNRHFNTNYTASWFLVRSAVNLSGTSGIVGSLQAKDSTCPVPSSEAEKLKSRNYTQGPLRIVLLDSGKLGSSFVPILGDGAATLTTLPQKIGDNEPGSQLVASFTAGPRDKTSINTVPTPPAASWWSAWKDTRQDYRNFGVVHGGDCNILFADGSVRTVTDTNDDGLLNSGFDGGQGGFVDSEVELQPEKFEVYYSLTDAAVHDL